MSRAAPEPNPYHHGDLRSALIAATEDLLAERGPTAFRCARWHVGPGCRRRHRPTISATPPGC